MDRDHPADTLSDWLFGLVFSRIRLYAGQLKPA